MDRTFHLGRLLDHVHIRVSDMLKAKQFYSAILAELGREPSSESGGHIAFDELWIDQADWSGASRVHLAFQAGDEESVVRFFEAGLKHGGRDNGPPGLRKYHAGYVAAYLLDPDGNNVEAVWHGAATRSSPSVTVIPNR
jgi:catechol 2,3-dioxygenase-like lactoylglutathione lyase family enzyme